VFSINTAFSGDTLHYVLRWLPPIPSWFPADSASGKVLLHFENARYKMNGLPEFCSLLPVQDNCSGVKIHIISLSYDTIPVTSQYSHLDHMPGNLDISAGIVKDARKNYARISFIPVLRKEDKLFLVKEFKAELIKTGNLIPKKSSNQRWKNASLLNSGIW
jgi:hypothetical protein